MSTHTITVELEVEVTYSTHQFSRGRREGGQQLEPDEPAGVTLESARIVNGPAIDLNLIPHLDDLEQELIELEFDDGSDRGEYEFDAILERRAEAHDYGR